MSATRARYEFIAALTRREATIPHNTVWVAERLLRMAATAQRLAVAACNGDWPADGGRADTIACHRCESLWAKSVMVRDHTVPKVQGPGEDKARWIPLLCPDCRTSDRLAAFVAAEMPGWRVSVGGDPRGWVVRLTAPDGAEIGVPANG